MSKEKLALAIEIAVAVIFVVCAYLVFGRSPDIRNYPPKAGPMVFLGDSLVRGVGASPGNDLPVLLSRVVGESVENFGVSGDTSAMGLARLDSVIAREPAVALILLGGNDYLQKVPVDETFSNLKSIITRLQGSGAVVIVIGIRGGALRDNFEDRFEALVAETGSAYVPDALGGIIGDGRYMSDAVHPNDAGYSRIAERIARVLKSVTKRP
ncbi:MAG: GDSL-type esterase/lipase family protein [Candidatus Paceibacterota bacterium]|jgi:acyl-CoA thioesterase-1